MPVRKTMLMSKGNLTFACGQVYEMLCEIEKVWRGTVSFAAVWRFKNTALLKSNQLAITCPSVIAKAQLCLKGNATEADVHEFLERSVRHYYLMRQRPFLKRVCVLHAGGFSTALRTELVAISGHMNKSDEQTQTHFTLPHFHTAMLMLRNVYCNKKRSYHQGK